ncbi:MAG: helical backbone metal receptor [Desulfuromusa sp.]|nr:helical backbone metal receptor [Desulfuromusa sp.]
MYRLLLVLLFFSFTTNAWCAQRIVLLSPAAGDIIHQLKADDLVVGVTRNLEGFTRATRVGSHIRPNVEIIRSLNPDLLIVSSNRFFSKEMAAAVGAEVFYYHPRSLDEIGRQITVLAQRLGKVALGIQLVARQWQKLKQLKPIRTMPRVVFEVTAMPLMVAGDKHIVADIIKRAGGTLIAPAQRKLVRYSIEAVLAQQPDIYIYQVGPMNKNPQPPQQRSSYAHLAARFLRVDELQFSRANTVSFDNVVKLNNYFYGEGFAQIKE